MNELIKRSFTGVLYVSLITVSALYSFTAVVVVMSLILYIAAKELSRILKFNDKDTTVFQTVSIASYYLIVLPVFVELGNMYHFPLALATAMIVVLAILRKYDMVFGWIYLTFPLALLAFMPGIPDLRFINGQWEYTALFSTRFILIFFILLWTYDVMAYVTGKLFGRNKLAPNISPGKTWEGLFGGLIFTVGVGFVLCHLFEMAPALIIPVCALIVLFGTLGDLLESMMKRQAGVKDSGTILPGHGGILDRIDGALMAIPVVVGYIHIYKNFF